jgi:hypothetical protein
VGTWHRRLGRGSVADGLGGYGSGLGGAFNCLRSLLRSRSLGRPVVLSYESEQETAEAMAWERTIASPAEVRMTYRPHPSNEAFATSAAKAFLIPTRGEHGFGAASDLRKSYRRSRRK